MKLRRNEPCWCGSGRKYKKCHLDRESAEKVPVSEALKVADDSRESRTCNSPPALKGECSGSAIKSHTISKALGLNLLAENGHVLGLKHDLSTLKKTGGKAELGPVGINKMSVFPGFCSYHDKRLFAPVEDSPFEATPEQCALLSYRALARERHTKLSGTAVNEFLKEADKGKSIQSQVAIQMFTASYGLGLSLATSDLDRALLHHYDAVISGDYSVFESLVFQLPSDFPLLCSTGHMPSDDWSGKIVQNLTSPTLKADWLTGVAIHSAGSAWVILTWLRSCTLIAGFVASLQENFEGSESDPLIKYFFSISENIAVRPSWWDSLEDVSKTALNERIMDGIPINGGANLTAPRKGEPTVLNLPVLTTIRV